jgi:hypothetical protein
MIRIDTAIAGHDCCHQLLLSEQFIRNLIWLSVIAMLQHGLAALYLQPNAMLSLTFINTMLLLSLRNKSTAEKHTLKEFSATAPCRACKIFSQTKICFTRRRNKTKRIFMTETTITIHELEFLKHMVAVSNS